MPASHEEPYRPATYRALMLRPDGSIVAIKPLIAADDNEAIVLAKAMVNGHAVELWDGLRYIECFDTSGHQP